MVYARPVRGRCEGTVLFFLQRQCSCIHYRQPLYTRPLSICEGKVLLQQREVLVFCEVWEACLDLAGGRTRLTQEMLGLRRVVNSSIYKIGEEGRGTGMDPKD